MTVIERLGQAAEGVVRAGCACYTSEDEVDRLVAGVAQVAGSLGDASARQGGRRYIPPGMPLRPRLPPSARIARAARSRWSPRPLRPQSGRARRAAPGRGGSVGPRRRRSWSPRAIRRSGWRATGDRVKVRRSPMLLTEHEGHYYELYLTDDDRSYYDAVILGQRILRRDLETGDSLLLLEDSTAGAPGRRLCAGVTRASRPCRPTKRRPRSPRRTRPPKPSCWMPSGPFLTFEQHVDIDVVGERDQHVTRRGVLDVRDGHAVIGCRPRRRGQAGGDLTARGNASSRRPSTRSGGPTTSGRAARRRRSPDSSSTRSRSPSSTRTGRRRWPSWSRVVGRAPGALRCRFRRLRITEGPWWAPIRAGLPDAPSRRPRCGAPRAYDVVAREDSSGESRAALSCASDLTNGPWRASPTPVRRVLRLDAPRVAVAHDRGAAPRLR